jgi:hypothetical protein
VHLATATRYYFLNLSSISIEERIVAVSRAIWKLAVSVMNAILYGFREVGNSVGLAYFGMTD